MAHKILASWADAVLDGENKTVADLLSIPGDDGWQYELVDGRLVRMPASGGEASTIAMQLGSALNTFVRAQKLGRVTGADGTFDLTQPGDVEQTALVPDVAFVQAARVPARDSDDYRKAWRLAPDLVAEVASPDQYRPEMAAKAQRYIAAGVRLVWIIWPKTKQVDVWRPSAHQQRERTLGSGEALDGLDVLAGFTFSLVDLFE